MSFIREEDLVFEHQLIKDPYDLDLWLQYYNFKTSQPAHSYTQLAFILTRALKYLNRSFKLWMIYLDLKIAKVGQETTPESVIRSFEMAMENDLSQFPQIWISYLNFLTKFGETTFTRTRFDWCLRSLPIQTHLEIWPLYLRFADKTRDFNAYRRFFHFKYAFVGLVVEPQFVDVLDALVDYSTKDDTETLIKELEFFITNSEIISSVDNEFDIYWKFIDVMVQRNIEQTDKVDKLVNTTLSKFPDQSAKVYVKWAKYYTSQQDNSKVQHIFEQGIEQCKSVREFSVIYDAYLEFQEKLVQKMVEDEDSRLDQEMTYFETLMNKRELMINDIHLKNDANNVDTWLKRVSLFDKTTQLKEVLETYVKAIMTVDPKKVHKGLQRLWIPYIRVYETNGDLSTARTILDKCVNVPFNDVDDLCEVWLEWANLELRNDDNEQAIKVLEKALISPVADVSYEDNSIPVQARVFKSFKLWSFYVDLVESSGNIAKTGEVYDKMIELKVAKPITVINYALFYEENQMFEKSLSVFERGLGIFQFPMAYEIWNIYLTKVLKFSKLIKIGNERIRDLFDQCIEQLPPGGSYHAIVLLYADFEEKSSNKNLSKMFNIYKQSVDKFDVQSTFVIYKAYISKAYEYLELKEIRGIYEQLINDDRLPLSPDLVNFVKDFVRLELRLKDPNRGRFILKNFYEFAMQSRQHGLSADLGDFWKRFELENGDEETFKDMIRFFRVCEVKFGKIAESKALQGFVKSSDGPKVSSINASEDTSANMQANPNAINLDFEDDDDDIDEEDGDVDEE